MKINLSDPVERNSYGITFESAKYINKMDYSLRYFEDTESFILYDDCGNDIFITKYDNEVNSYINKEKILSGIEKMIELENDIMMDAYRSFVTQEFVAQNLTNKDCFEIIKVIENYFKNH